MGTRFELALIGGGSNIRAAGEAALDEVVEWHRRLNRFAPDSLLSHINRTAAQAPVRLDRETFALFEDAQLVWRASGGAFDITVACAMVGWGFADSAVSAMHGRVDAGAIELDSSSWTIRFCRPDVSVDLGGIAKGHALDCAAAVLRDSGIACALLHGGTSSVIAIGSPPDERGWRIALGGDSDAPVVALADSALSVSNGASQQTSMASGHIVDPRNGRVVGRPGRAAVIGPSARLADAWSTALVVLGGTSDPSTKIRVGLSSSKADGLPSNYHCFYFASAMA